MTDPMELVGRAEAKNAPGHINIIDSDTTEELLDLLTEAAACIREMVAWRPIETAPRDGTKIDVWHGDERMTDVYWSDTQDAWCFDGVCGPEEPTPLAAFPPVRHWLPLPPAPGAEDE